MATDNDRAVLDAIFSPFEVTTQNFSPETVNGVEEVASPEGTVQEAHQLEIEGVQAAENGNLIEAIELFTQSLDLVPSLASAYNNRAQAHRLNAAPEGTPASIYPAMEDLNRAIELSKGCGHVATQAFCQRGLLYERQGQREEALKDFHAACGLGSGFAKSALVQLNPYAALCNQMLSEMFNKLTSGAAE